MSRRLWAVRSSPPERYTITTSKSPAAPPRERRFSTVRDSVDRMLAESPVAMPLTSDWAYCTPDSDWSTAACRLAPSSWSLICRNSTRLTMTTTTPATSMVMAPTRSCSEDRQACAARRMSRAPSTIVRRRARRSRRRTPARSWPGVRCRRRVGSGAEGCGGGASGPSSAEPTEGSPVVVLMAGRRPGEPVGARRPRCSRGTCLVADAAHGQHDLGLLRVALDLRPQPLDVHVDQPGVGGVSVAPHLLEQQLAGEDLPWFAGQRDQQVELQRGQRDRHPVTGDLVGRDVDLDVA